MNKKEILEEMLRLEKDKRKINYDKLGYMENGYISNSKYRWKWRRW